MLVADAHGVLSRAELQKLFGLFDGFIIHSSAESAAQLEETVRLIKKGSQSAQVVSVVHDENLKRSSEVRATNQGREFRVRRLEELQGDQLFIFLS